MGNFAPHSAAPRGFQPAFFCINGQNLEKARRREAVPIHPDLFCSHSGHSLMHQRKNPLLVSTFFTWAILHPIGKLAVRIAKITVANVSFLE